MQREKYLKQLKASLQNDKITFLIGARQVGKTTLLKQFQAELDDCVFLSCDEIALKEFTSAQDLLNYFALTYNLDFAKIKYLLLDEVQSVKNINLFLKDLHDNHHFKIFASGSGSLKIFQGISESLIGRKEIIYVYPFSFEEFLQAKSKTLLPLREFTPSSQAIYNDLLEEYLIFGGYPEVVFSQEKIKVLKSIYNTYLEQDIYHYIKNQDLIAFSKFYKLLAGSIGSLQKIDALRQKVNIHRTKAEEFSFILNNTFITDLVAPFVRNLHKEIQSHQKIYFNDPGFINSSWDTFAINPLNKGILVENFVLNELRKNQTPLYEIYFWRKKSQVEIDFILRDLQKNKLIPIEVKASGTQVIPPSFRSFYNDYKTEIAFFVVLNESEYTIREFEDKKVVFLPYYYAQEIYNLNF